VSEGEGGLAGSGWHGVRGAEAADSGDDVAHSLEAAPQGLGSRLAIVFAGEEAAELGDGANHLAQRRWLLGRWLRGLEDDDGLPLVFLEGDSAGKVRRGARGGLTRHRPRVVDIERDHLARLDATPT
jgi:hypothetical protein